MPVLNYSPRKPFDVNDKNDLEKFAGYLKNSAWGPGGCPFQIEDPWNSIPDMIKDKITRKHLGIK